MRRTAQAWLPDVAEPADERREREARAVELEIARVYGQIMASRSLSSHPDIVAQRERTEWSRFQAQHAEWQAACEDAMANPVDYYAEDPRSGEHEPEHKP